MMDMKKILSYLLIPCVVLLAALIIISPKTCAEGARLGILLCGKIIIPSLFPFTFCTIFLMRTPLLSRAGGRLNIIFAFILSLLGGYPVGAKLINELAKNGVIDIKSAHIMQCFCVNAGPAFVISAVGLGVFKSQKIGVLLFAALCLSALTVFTFLFKFISKTESGYTKSAINLNTADNFVISTYDAASSVFSICGFVILFSVINNYIKLLSRTIAPLKLFLFFTEVSSAVTQTENIYFVAFILGFAGLSIWLQIFSSSKDCGVNLPLFITFRFLSAALASIYTFVLISLFKITVPTLSNNIAVTIGTGASSKELIISVIITIILFLLFCQSKKYSGKIYKDML